MTRQDATRQEVIGQIQGHLESVGILLMQHPNIVELGDVTDSVIRIVEEADAVTRHAIRAVAQILAQAVGIADEGRPMCSALAKIYSDLENAKSPLPDQAPAIQCAVVMRSGVTIQGALSASEHGGLRMMSQCGAAGPEGIPMVEQFFDGADVEIYGVPKHVVVDTPRIIRS